MTTTTQAKPAENLLASLPIATRNKLLYWAVYGSITFVLLTCLMFALGSNLWMHGASAIAATLAAVALVPLYICFFLWLDRFEPEPIHLLFAAFIWGAGVSALLALALNTGISDVLGSNLSPETNELVTTSIVAPIIEETLKGLAVAILFFWLKNQFDGVIDGIMYAGMAALGFAFTENIHYYAGGIDKGAFLSTFLQRGIQSPYAHVLFTSMTGIGFGLSRQSKNLGIKLVAPLAGWILAMALHFTWNTLCWAPALVTESRSTMTVIGLLVYIAFWMPLFLALLGVIALSLRQESKLIRRHLLENSEESHITEEQAASAAKLWPRLIGNLHILFTKGTADWIKARRFQIATTSLAFHRERVQRGRIPANAEVESLHIEQILANKPE